MKKRIFALILAAALLTALLCGCGGSSVAQSSYAVTESYSTADFAPMAEAAYDYEYETDGDYWAAAEEMPVPDPMPPTGEAPGAPQNGVKLIYTANLDMETMDFDGAVTALAKLTAEVGGYYESSSVSDQSSYRWAEYTIRVPAGYYRVFLDEAGDLCHVLSQREYTEDVSEAYYDTSGRLETQKTKLARLQELLLEAENMEDIITIESAISETEEMIDRLSGTLRHYDALVDYSTVTVYLKEVKVYEPEPDPTYGSRLGSAFVDGLKGFAEGLGDILVALAYSWLWLLLIAGVVALILWLTRKRRAAKKAERAERRARAKARKGEQPQYTLPADKTGDGE